MTVSAERIEEARKVLGAWKAMFDETDGVPRVMLDVVAGLGCDVLEALDREQALTDQLAEALELEVKSVTADQWATADTQALAALASYREARAT